MDSIFNPQGGLGAGITAGADSNMMDGIFSQGNMDLGMKGFGLYNNYQQQKANKDMMNRKMSMAEDAYGREVEADEKRQALNF